MAKSKWESHICPFLGRIAKWAENGASQNEIAKKLKVAPSTFKLYLAKGDKGEQPYTDLSDCFRRACDDADDKVEASLYKSATGYNARVSKTFKVKEIIYDENTGKKISETEKLVTGEDEVHIPANVTAQMFWLANRRGDKWKYKPDATGEDESNGTGVVELPAVMDKPVPPEEGAENG